MNVLTEAIEGGVPLLIVSPHLDDAALSCGALILDAVDRTSVTVATIFTEADHPPHTLSARRYLHQVEARNAVALYQRRRAEDRAAFEPIGVTCVHAGLTEALFRRLPHRTPRSWFARALPELVHTYPTYRGHISRGRISATDSETTDHVADVIRSWTRTVPSVVMAPLGVGSHVDHVLVRDATARSGAEVVYYSDFPYNQTQSPDQDFIVRNGLVELRWTQRIAAKADLIRSYKTQVGALFDGDRIPVAPEVFYSGPSYKGIPFSSGVRDAVEVQD
jgi:LmbE family N-acetylglucosaminyl deacetylase